MLYGTRNYKYYFKKVMQHKIKNKTIIYLIAIKKL